MIQKTGSNYVWLQNELFHHCMQLVHSARGHLPPDTGRIYIKGYLYPILYPKISKKDISYPFLEQDILKI
jgi:hypothetical protein